MKILVKLGELFNAERLIPIDSAHISGVSYKTLGDAPIEFLRALSYSKAKVKVRTTINPQSLDPKYLGRKLPRCLRDPQLDILKQFNRMGTTPSLTCTPYYIRRPRRGVHLAWAESSADVYTNSVLGAWTNREGGPSALAAAIIGRTPNCGMHKPENRESDILVNVEKPLTSETEFGALGILLGKELRDEVPAIQGLEDASNDELKQFSAGLGTAGMTSMFNHKKTLKRKGIDEMTVGAKEIGQIIESLSTASTSKPDLVFIGCPHCSLDEITHIAQQIDGKKVTAGTEFWICTSPYIAEKAKKYVNKIEATGAHVLAGVCTVVSWTETLGIKTIMTNSAKTAYYAPTLNKAQTILAPLKNCLTAAFKG